MSNNLIPDWDALAMPPPLEGSRPHLQPTPEPVSTLTSDSDEDSDDGSDVGPSFSATAAADASVVTSTTAASPDSCLTMAYKVRALSLAFGHTFILFQIILTENKKDGRLHAEEYHQFFQLHLLLLYCPPLRDYIPLPFYLHLPR